MNRDRVEALALVVVMSFAAGVLAMDLAREHREAEALAVAERAIAAAEVVQLACGMPGPVVIQEPPL